MLGLDELEAELATLAAHLYAGTCRWLELVGELDRRGGWTEEGCGSCADWIAWRCALTPRAAREHVRVARRLPELPRTHAAFACGELSYAKVRALTRVATTETEDELLELARLCTAAQLERTVRAYRRVTTDEAREQQEGTSPQRFLASGRVARAARPAQRPRTVRCCLRALDALRDSLWQRSARFRGTAAGAAGLERGKRWSRWQRRRSRTRARIARAGSATRSSSTPTRRRSRATARAVARSRTAVRSPPRPRAGSPATPRSCGTAGGRGRSRRRCGGRCGCATAAAASPAARTAASSTPTTSGTGRKGGETPLDNLILLCRRHHRARPRRRLQRRPPGTFLLPVGREHRRRPSAATRRPWRARRMQPRPRGRRRHLRNRHRRTTRPRATPSTLCSRSLGFRSTTRAGPGLSNPESP